MVGLLGAEEGPYNQRLLGCHGVVSKVARTIPFTTSPLPALSACFLPSLLSRLSCGHMLLTLRPARAPPLPAASRTCLAVAPQLYLSQFIF